MTQERRNAVHYTVISLSLALSMSVTGCGQDLELSVLDTTVEPASAEPHQATRASTATNISIDDFEPDPAHSHYLFDVTEHGIEDLQRLLVRINDIAENRLEGYDGLEIVMILHGPDINLFTYQSYAENKHLVDLAAKLDAFNIIDMKVCETALPEFGVSRSDLPPFIESVPFAPAEKQRLNSRGYINL